MPRRAPWILSNYYTSSETQSYVANELLAYYPRTELDSLLTATLTQYWTSGRTQTEIDDAIAGAGFQTQAVRIKPHAFCFPSKTKDNQSSRNINLKTGRSHTARKYKAYIVNTPI